MTDPSREELPFLTMREAVMEIRGDVKELASTMYRIDREGSIGTKQELMDHESRLRRMERLLYSIPSIAVLSLASSIAYLVYQLVLR